MNIQELRDGLGYVETALRSIHETAGPEPLDEATQARWDEGTVYVEATRKQIADYEAREAAVGAMNAGKGDKGDQNLRDKSFSFQSRERTDAENVLNNRSATPRQISDAILRSIDDNDLPTDYAAKILKRHSADTRWSRDLLLRSTDVYADAWSKCITGRAMFLSNEERAAISATTDANGGYLVPTHLDPTVILTNEGSSNAIRPLARVVTLTEGNVWNGVTSAGVTASADAPLTEVSDDSPTFGAPTVSIHKAQSFVQATIEALQDINGLAMEVVTMFADAKDRLEGTLHCTGSGTNEAVGIFTALDANTNVEIASTTAATIGLVDLQGVRRAVGQRWRGRSTWVMNPIWADEVKRLGTALSASYSTDITQSNTDRLLGRPVVETDDAPEVTTTTALDNRIVFGDFSNYVIVDKPGSTSIHYLQPGILQNTTTNLPDGRVGWYMYWRTGADSVNDVAFRLLQDKTSA